MNDAAVTAPLTVYAVCGPRGVEQVFTDRAAAQRFAGELTDCRVSQHVLRSTDEEAILVVDRRVVVGAGEKRADETRRFRHFTDESFTMPQADVEWFRDQETDEWHIVGFGTDAAELDASVRRAVEHVLTVDDATAGQAR